MGDTTSTWVFRALFWLVMFGAHSLSRFSFRPDQLAVKPWYVQSPMSYFYVPHSGGVGITPWTSLTFIIFFFSAWAIATNQSQKVFGVTLGGEFSSAINDCGLWWAFIQLFPGLRIYWGDLSDLVFVLLSLSRRLSGIGSTPSSPDCATWDNWSVSHFAICVTFCHLYWPYRQLTGGFYLIGVHTCDYSKLEKRLPRFHGCTPGFLFLDVENWKFNPAQHLFFPHVALPTRTPTRMDS